MFYDFIFANSSRDADFFLKILIREAHHFNLTAAFYALDSQTHFIVLDVPALMAHITTSETDDSSRQRILEFSQQISLKLPLSLYFRFLEIKPIVPNETFYTLFEQNHNPIQCLQETLGLPLCDIAHDEIILEPKTYYFDALETRQILDSSSDFYAQPNTASFNQKLLLPPDFSSFLNHAIDELCNHQPIILHTQYGIKTLSLQPLPQNQMCVACDIASLKTYFRIHQAQIDALASFEKPSVCLVPKEVFQQNFPQNPKGEVLVSLPYDIILALIGAKLLQKDIDYFFLSYAEQGLSQPFDFRHSILPAQQILCVAQNGVFIDTSIKGKDLSSLVSAHIAQEEPSQRTLVIYLSTRHSSVFMVCDSGISRSMLDIAFETNPRLIIEDIIQSYESGKDLVDNFNHITHNQALKLLNLSPKSHISHNLTDLFATAAQILNFTDSDDMMQCKNTLFALANTFVRDRGPRIDFHLLKDQQNTLTLDYNRAIRSSLSFKCAQMENVILAYGFLDSMSEFVATLIRDTQINFEIKRTLLLGDMLSNAIFLDRLLGYLPKNINLILPKDGLMDY
ncbi:hypothetical protein LS68_007010 [Helicobacter sp. MIT 05-5293]|uniref:hypothetical protein n=1 Tax=Helicobacter sp. MIT 05-5293 TaxID=1548149 RepID=UPI00051D8428|nr:hypothetical protein [Helicobacter sp. MIT 05-5293]TLD80491.1 hypothetical protein LS68_007010 [Helicobacter sp. MIT 05-5293]